VKKIILLLLLLQSYMQGMTAPAIQKPKITTRQDRLMNHDVYEIELVFNRLKQDAWGKYSILKTPTDKWLEIQQKKSIFAFVNKPNWREKQRAYIKSWRRSVNLFKDEIENWRLAGIQRDSLTDDVLVPVYWVIKEGGERDRLLQQLGRDKPKLREKIKQLSQERQEKMTRLAKAEREEEARVAKLRPILREKFKKLREAKRAQ